MWLYHVFHTDSTGYIAKNFDKLFLKGMRTEIGLLEDCNTLELKYLGVEVDCNTDDEPSPATNETHQNREINESQTRGSNIFLVWRMITSGLMMYLFHIL